MDVRRRFQVQALLLAVVFLSVCLMSGFTFIKHTCANCTDPVICYVLAEPQLSSWQPDIILAFVFFVLAAKILSLAVIGQFPENLCALSLVKWKIQMNN